MNGAVISKRIAPHRQPPCNGSCVDGGRGGEDNTPILGREVRISSQGAGGRSGSATRSGRVALNGGPAGPTTVRSAAPTSGSGPRVGSGIQPSPSGGGGAPVQTVSSVPLGTSASSGHVSEAPTSGRSAGASQGGGSQGGGSEPSPLEQPHGHEAEAHEHDEHGSEEAADHHEHEAGAGEKEP